MQKQTRFTTAMFLAGCFLCGSVFARQALAQSSSPAAAQSATPPAKSTTTTAHRTTTARKPAPIELKTDRDKESYAIGMNIAKGLQSQSKLFDFDPKLLEQGLKDGLAGGKPLLTEDEIRAALTSLQTQVREKEMALQAEVQKEMQEKAEANQKAGDAFLEANKAKEGVQVLPDGLQYKVLAEGHGPKPAATDTVVCNYRGTLIDGTEFDSSEKHGGQPLNIPVSAVIKGWTEALQLMPVGSKWELYIPSNLAYGPQGKGPIGPNSTLIFQIELLSIKPKPEPATPSTPEPPSAPPSSSTTPQPSAPPTASAAPPSSAPQSGAAPAPPGTPQPEQTPPQSAAPATPKNRP